MRKLPVYLVLDTSGSMKGEPIESVNVGVQSMISALKSDPYALECVSLCVITFDNEARVHTPLTPLDLVQIAPITTPESGATFLGAALNLLFDLVDVEVVKTTKEVKGDWRPILFLMTDGSPSDTYDFEQATSRMANQNFATVVACAAGPKAKTASLEKLTENVVSLDTMDSAAFDSFFKWVSDSVAVGGTSMGSAESMSLPPPPPTVNIVS